jgi:hypothetical protein
MAAHAVQMHACASPVPVPVEQKEDCSLLAQHMRGFLKREIELQLETHAVLWRAHALADSEISAALRLVHPSMRPTVEVAVSNEAWTLELDAAESADLARLQRRVDRDVQSLKLKVHARKRDAAAKELDDFNKGLALRLAQAVTAYFEQPASPELLTQAVADFHGAVAARKLDSLICALAACPI